MENTSISSAMHIERSPLGGSCEYQDEVTSLLACKVPDSELSKLQKRAVDVSMKLEDSN